MSPSMGSLIYGIVKLLLVAGGMLYAGLVIMSYRVDGPHARLELEPADPARSAEHLLVWLGVKGVAVTIRLSTALLGILAEASAEVGEWLMRRGGPGLRQSFRSRFMI
jgi:hypothetical protein